MVISIFNIATRKYILQRSILLPQQECEKIWFFLNENIEKYDCIHTWSFPRIFTSNPSLKPYFLVSKMEIQKVKFVFKRARQIWKKSFKNCYTYLGQLKTSRIFKGGGTSSFPDVLVNSAYGFPSLHSEEVFLEGQT